MVALTTIAYSSKNGGEIASDSVCLDGTTNIANIKKIWRVKGGLCGAAGDVVAMLHFLRWLRAGADEEEYPNFKTIGRFHAVVINPQGKIKLFEHSGPEFYSTNDPYCAIGAGADFALGALYAGASAKDAVRAAIRHHCNTMGPVQSLKLKKIIG